MAQNYHPNQQPSNKPYSDTPPFPTQYTASAPAADFQAPPQYSVLDPSLQHQQQLQQQQPYIQPYQPSAVIQQQPPVVQQVQHVVIVQAPVSRHPQSTTCPSCRCNIVTKVKSEPNVVTHIIAGILCFLCWLPCVCLPYCIDSCQSSVHYCPNCAAYIGSYRGFRQ